MAEVARRGEGGDEGDEVEGSEGGAGVEGVAESEREKVMRIRRKWS